MLEKTKINEKEAGHCHLKNIISSSKSCIWPLAGMYFAIRIILLFLQKLASFYLSSFSSYFILSPLNSSSFSSHVAPKGLCRFLFETRFRAWQQQLQQQFHSLNLSLFLYLSCCFCLQPEMPTYLGDSFCEHFTLAATSNKL